MDCRETLLAPSEPTFPKKDQQDQDDLDSGRVEGTLDSGVNDLPEEWVDRRRRPPGGPTNPRIEASARAKEVYEEVGAGSRDALWNDHSASYGILHEQPWHRLAIWMKVQGVSNKVIARQFNKTPFWVGQMLRQPWARTRMLEIMNENGLDEVQTILKGALADSVYKLIDLRDDPETPAPVVRGVCTDLIHQYLGKPRQQVDVTATTGLEHLSDEELRQVVSPK